jgi:hypothetical protein
MTDNAETRATRDGSRVALVTCSEIADLDPDDRLVIAPLRARGIAAQPAVWDAPVDWSAYDLAVLRSPWDYAPRREAFVAWADRVPRLANPAEVVRWNTDKRYLAALAASGAPTVPTTWVAPGDAWRPPPAGEYVIKPAVSAGSKDTGRYDLADSDHRRLAAEHVERLSAAGRDVMVQPYLSAVDDAGETALLFFAGADGLAFSHAIRKGPLLTGPDFGVDGLYKAETIERRTVAAAELEVARRVLDAVPGGTDRLLYARVDLIPDADGAPLLVELELTEPSLFLAYDAGAPDRFAEAIASRVR